MVYVLNKEGKPLMPTRPAKARKLLRQEKAIVIFRIPFTIQLLYGSSGYKQPVILGYDSGYTNIGLSAITKKEEVFSGEVKLRDNIVKLYSERRQYRRTRRNRKTWYRKAKILNRKKEEGWLAPSIKHKFDSHRRIIEKIKKILPVTKIIIEVANFDIQKIKNPSISGVEYQQGDKKDFYNTREYVFHRDGHLCRNCKRKSKDPVLELHHLVSRQTGGERPDNFITLCSTCHSKVSKGKLILNITPTRGFKAETFMSTIRWKLINALREEGNNVYHTYGYITKSTRIEAGLSKSHSNDAFIIAGGQEQVRSKVFIIRQNRRNNRALQLNRKGFKPSVRKKRYCYQPQDIVKFNNRLYTVKGVFNYGKWIRISDREGNILNLSVSKVSLLKYQRGFAFEY